MRPLNIGGIDQVIGTSRHIHILVIIDTLFQ